MLALIKLDHVNINMCDFDFKISCLGKFLLPTGSKLLCRRVCDSYFLEVKCDFIEWKQIFDS